MARWTSSSLSYVVITITRGLETLRAANSVMACNPSFFGIRKSSDKTSGPCTLKKILADNWSVTVISPCVKGSRSQEVWRAGALFLLEFAALALMTLAGFRLRITEAALRASQVWRLSLRDVRSRTSELLQATSSHTLYNPVAQKQVSQYCWHNCHHRCCESLRVIGRVRGEEISYSHLNRLRVLVLRQDAREQKFVPVRDYEENGRSNNPRQSNG